MKILIKCESCSDEVTVDINCIDDVTHQSGYRMDINKNWFCPKCQDTNPVIINLEKKYLCYQELQVDDRTFCIYKIVSGKNPENALERLYSENGKNYNLKTKGCLGEICIDLINEHTTRAILNEQFKFSNKEKKPYG